MTPQSEISPEHLNSSGCIIQTTADKGRGVYASRSIPAYTVIEISPVLFFSKEEYTNHGRHTVLDHYTFVWPDGRMALALGLGSLFNHSDPPNVSYTLDTVTDSIRYTTSRGIESGEELCIFYGHKLWFTPAGGDTERPTSPSPDAWAELASLEVDEESQNPYAKGDQAEVIPEEDLPFWRFKLPPEEEDIESVRTVEAWVVDVPDQRHIATLLKWLKQAGLDEPHLGHLKRIRKQGNMTTLLLSTTPEVPQLPADLSLPAPYTLPVPSSSAITLPALTAKSTFWPTIYTPSRKDEIEPWTRGKLKWAWDSMRITIEEAVRASTFENELPTAAYIPPSFDPERGLPLETGFLSSDTRNSTRHPLRHAAINAVRKLADKRASEDSASTTSSEGEKTNGTNYLLTDQMMFMTHEPCIMCSMALLHSRVKEVVFLHSMKLTGGCGGCTCLPVLKGVNHRFGILQWKPDKLFMTLMERTTEVDASIDI